MLAWLWRKKSPQTLLEGMQASATTVEISMEVPTKLKIDLPYDPTIRAYIQEV
jgi:hypothetical protein